MPLRLPSPTPTGDGLFEFIGVNLRRDRFALADNECAVAINADFHTMPGAALLRAGRTRLSTIVYDGQVVAIEHVNNRRYIMTTTSIYRAQAQLAVGLDATGTTVTSFRPLGDTNTWAFIMNRNTRQKDNGLALVPWGITAPTTAPAVATGAAGSLRGSYKTAYTYVRKVGSAVVTESNPSPTSAAVTLASQVLSVTGLVTPTDTQVTHLRLYRTLNSGSLLLFDQDIAAGTTTATSSKADNALGSQVAVDNNLPPAAFWASEFQGTMFAVGDSANPDYLWFSKRFQPEAWPPSNFLQIGTPQDPLLCLAPQVGTLGVFTNKTKYRLLGNSTSGYVPLEALSKRGVPTSRAMVPTDEGALFVARDGLFLTDFIASDALLSSSIEPLFYEVTVNGYAPIDWARAAEITVGAWKQRYYFSYPSTDGANMMAVFSRETRHWYFYQYAEPVTALLWELSTGLLLAGTKAGLLTSVEVPLQGDETGNIFLTIEGRDKYGGDPAMRKVFQYFRTDVQAISTRVLLEILIDGVVRHRQMITGDRTRQLYRFPDGIMGYTWRPRWTYEGTTHVGVFDIEVFAVPLRHM